MTTPPDPSQAQWEADFQSARQRLITAPSDALRQDAILNMLAAVVVDGAVAPERVARVVALLLEVLPGQSAAMQQIILDAITQLPPAGVDMSGLLNLVADTAAPAPIREQASALLLRPDSAAYLGGSAQSNAWPALRAAASLADPVLAAPAIQILTGFAALAPQRIPAAVTARRILHALVITKGGDGSYLQPNPQLRAQMLQALVNMHDLDIVLRALLDDGPVVQDLVASYLDDAKAAGRVTSPALSEALIRLLTENAQYQSANLRADTRDRLMRVLRPAPEESVTDPEDLSRRLLTAALQARQDERLAKLFADLLEASVGDKDRTGDLINRYQAEQHIADDALLALRSQIGGRTTLAPIMRTLDAQQIEYFQDPIKKLNDTTQANWLKTIDYAQKGFLVRMVMSVVVFVVGITLVISSAFEILFGGRPTADLWGPGITLAGGLAAMFAVVYSGPLKDIRQSVNDLGVASAVFIGYIHRILEISHTFTYHYLNKEITYDEMTKSSTLLAAAMQDIYRMLPHNPLPPDSQEPLSAQPPANGGSPAGEQPTPPPDPT